MLHAKLLLVRNFNVHFRLTMRRVLHFLVIKGKRIKYIPAWTKTQRIVEFWAIAALFLSFTLSLPA